MNLSEENNWPPQSGSDFIRSEAFGEMILQWCRQLASRYPRMDFTDAASHVFSWFDGKLQEDPSFINQQRFRSQRAFLAYLRQCVWNAGRLAERQRKRRENITAIPAAEYFVSQPPLTEDQLSRLIDALQKLDVIKKTVFERLFFEEDDEQSVADGLNLTVDQIRQLFAEAIDELGNLL